MPTPIHWGTVLKINDLGVTSADFDTSFERWDEEGPDPANGAANSDSLRVWITGLNHQNVALAEVITYTQRVEGLGWGRVRIERRQSDVRGALALGALEPGSTWFRQVFRERFEDWIEGGTDSEILEDITEGNPQLHLYKLDDAGRSLGREWQGSGYGPPAVFEPGATTRHTPTGALDWLTDISPSGVVAGRTAQGAALWLEGGKGKRINLEVPVEAGIAVGSGKTFATAVDDTLQDRVWVVGQVGGEMEPGWRRWAGGHAVAWQSNGPLDSADLTWTFIDVAKGAPAGWSNLTLLDVNYHGQACGFALVNGAWTAVRVTLTTKLIAFDLNRDGRIDFNDPSDHTTADKPFRFWLNDDNDSSGVEKQSGRDNRDSLISHIRDLEDFCRLGVKIDPSWKGKIEAGYKLLLDLKGDGRFKLHLMAEMENETDYLTSITEAENQIFLSYFHFRNNKLIKPKQLHEHLEDRHYETGVLLLLLEGVKEGPIEITLRLVKPGRKGETEAKDTAYLHLHPIKDFFDHSRAVSTNRLNAPYRQNAQPPNVLLENVHPKLVPPGEDETKHCIVWIHGWRLPVWERQNWAEMMFKRLWHAGYKGRFAAFSWFTLSADDFGLSKGILTYNDSEYRAWKAAPALSEYLQNTRQQLPQDYSLNLVAHSMGNVLTSEAVRLGAPFDRYVMMQAAVSASAYDPDPALRDPDFVATNVQKPTPVEFNSLGYVDYFRDLPKERIINFYNKEDYALRTGREGFGTINTSWTGNNIDYKPQPISSQRSYRYEPLVANGPAIAGLFRYPPRGAAWKLERQLTDPHESMAYLARSLTHAVGAERRTRGGLLGDGVDLNTTFGFTRDRPEHSAQFNRPIQGLLHRDADGRLTGIHPEILRSLGTAIGN